MPSDPQPVSEINPATNPKFYLDSKKLDLEAKKIEQDHVVQLRRMQYDHDPGYLGRLVGSPRNAPNNIAFAVLVLVSLAGVVASFLPERIEFWKIISPTIALVMGYLLGQNTSKPAAGS